eukprot:4389752-Pleurochrysis_carterae.AAC.2
MVFIIRGNQRHVKHGCQSDASDWAAAGNVLHIPALSAPTAVTLAPISHLNLTTLTWRYNP